MSDFKEICERERGLFQSLSSVQMSMIAMGGAIGTGLFLGSAFAINMAGPSVLVSFAIGALISLLLIGCLAEMAITHPTAGSFGAYAEFYLNPFMGFLVRYAYWACNVLAAGTEITAIGKYMAYWFPDIPAWTWAILFACVLILINVVSVKIFGAFEALLSMLKIMTIVLFICIGCYIVFGKNIDGIGWQNYIIHGGLLPHGLGGMWNAVIIALFGYFGLEMIGIATGEAQNPEKTIKSTFRVTLVRLILFYFLSISLMLAIIPWNEASEDKSPFVVVMEILNFHGAAGVINFIVLTAALSAMNSQIYAATRMMFSLSRSGFSPAIFGKVSKHGIPLAALFVSCSGIALAIILSYFWHEKAFVLMMSIAIFGALFTWFMIFVIHLAFRIRRNKQGLPRAQFSMWGFPATPLIGAFLVLAVMATTLFTDYFFLTLLTGIPFLLCLAVIYKLVYKR